VDPVTRPRLSTSPPGLCSVGQPNSGIQARQKVCPIKSHYEECPYLWPDPGAMSDKNHEYPPLMLRGTQVAHAAAPRKTRQLRPAGLGSGHPVSAGWFEIKLNPPYFPFKFPKAEMCWVLGEQPDVTNYTRYQVVVDSWPSPYLSEALNL
jgi:hypothetical protein